MALLLAIEHFDYMLIVLTIGLIAGYLGYMIGINRDKEDKEPPTRQRSNGLLILEIGQTSTSKKYHNPQKPCCALKYLRKKGITKDIGFCAHCFPIEPTH